MLRILTFTICLLLVAGLIDVFSISSWAYFPQDKSVNKDTASASKTESQKPEQQAKSSDAPKPEIEPQRNLKKNPAQATALLKRAREKLLSYSSIRAHITETVNIGPKSFVISGNYLQGNDLKLKLNFQVQSHKKDGKPVGTLLEICDGQVLWTEHTIKGNSRVTRRDVKAIMRQAELNPKSRPNMLVASLGLGGLPGLLAAIQKSMAFQSVAEITVNGKTLTVLNGRWNDQFLAQLKGGAANAAVQLPHYVPDAIRIYLDPESLFPRRIVYLKNNNNTLESIVTLNFSKVILNAPIDKAEFAYEPPDGVFPADVTNQYLKQLTQ